MKFNKKLFAVLAVVAMMAVSLAPMLSSTDSDAATAAIDWDGSDYSYTLTYNKKYMGTSDTSDDYVSPLSVSGMEAISSPSYSNGTVSGYGSWTWDSVTGLGPFNSFYAAFDADDGNKMVARLNPYDLTKTIDGYTLGTDSPYTSTIYNIMWMLPTVYWTVTDTSITLSSTETTGSVAYAHTINGHVYNFVAYAVYEGSTTTIDNATVLTSTTGSTPTTTTTRETFRGYANAYEMDSSLMEDGSNLSAYSMLWNFPQWQLYRWCCLTLMEDFNSQATVGSGKIYSDSSADSTTYGSNVLTIYNTTGQLDTSGPYAGTIAPSDAALGTATNNMLYGTDSVKLFIENAWGSVNDFVDGVVMVYSSVTEDSDTVYKLTSYVDLNAVPSDAVASGDNIYVCTGDAVIGDGWGSAIATGTGTDEQFFWGYPVAKGASSTSGTTDYYWNNSESAVSSSPTRVLCVGGAGYTYAGSAAQYGLSAAFSIHALSYSSAPIGARLAFVLDVDSTASQYANVTLDVNSKTDYGDLSATQITVESGSEVTVSGNTLTIGSYTITATPDAATSSYTYQFGYWSIADGATITEDTTITATFERLYTVTYNGNADDDTGTVTLGASTASGGALTPVTLTSASSSQYFTGWYTKASSGKLVGVEGTYYYPSSGITLYAHWSDTAVYTYAINYDANGGYNSPSAYLKQTSADGTMDCIITAKEPSRAGYYFAGWSTSDTATEATYDGHDTISVTAGSPITLYAVWTTVEPDGDYDWLVDILPVLVIVGLIMACVGLFISARSTDSSELVRNIVGITIAAAIVLLIMIPLLGAL